MLDSASNDHDLRLATKHVWNRAFLFKQYWTPEERKYVSHLVLTKTLIQDQDRIKKAMSESFYEAESFIIKSVTDFAEMWLKTPLGVEYVTALNQYKYVRLSISCPLSLIKHRKIRKPAVAPKPDPPANGDALLRRSGEIYWPTRPQVWLTCV